MKRPLRFQVQPEHHGTRLDLAIAAHLPEVSRTRAKRALSEGGVFVDRKRVKVASRVVQQGQMIELHLLSSEPASVASETAFDVRIVKQTSDYVVVDKPSGMFSAPTPESDERDLIAHLSRALGEGKSEFYLVHRLDRPTSGLMVVARTKAAAAHLSAEVASHAMSRRYLCVLIGALSETTEVTSPIEARSAHTTFVPREARADACLVEAILSTGRTHQVRIHADALGTPVAGDSKYGRAFARRLPIRPPRLCLHAHALSFVDPSSRVVEEFHSPLPAELQSWLDALPAHSTSQK